MSAASEAAPFRTSPSRGGSSRSSSTTAFCNGGVAGCVAKTATAPFTRLVALKQTMSLREASANKCRGVPNTLIALCKDGGMKAMWKGNLYTLAHRFPFTGLNFATHEFATSMLPNAIQQSSVGAFIPGAIAGSVAVVACYPLEFMRTQVMIHADEPLKELGKHGHMQRDYRQRLAWLRKWLPGSQFVDIYRSVGVCGLYRGLGFGLTATVPAVSISFGVYRLVRNRLDAVGILKDSLAGICIAGGGSGMAAAFMTFPLDVLRRRQQAMGAYSGIPQRSCREEAKNILRREGPLGFYRGIVPELAKVVPSLAITFLVFEHLR